MKAAVLSMVLLLAFVMWKKGAPSQPDALPVATASPFSSAVVPLPASAKTDATVSATAPASHHPASAAKDILQRLHSLRGAALPDGLRVDAQGELVTDLQLKLLFDFLLAARHDVSANELDELLRVLAQTLPEQAALQASQLWQDYRQYQDEWVVLIQTQKPHTSAGSLAPHQIAALEHLFSQREQLQQHWLGNLAEPWFGEDNAYDRQMLERAQARQPVVEPAIPPSLDEHPHRAAYERQRDNLLQGQALAPADQAEALEQLRREHFPERKAYLRQTLRDLSRPAP